VGEGVEELFLGPNGRIKHGEGRSAPAAENSHSRFSSFLLSQSVTSLEQARLTRSQNSFPRSSSLLMTTFPYRIGEASSRKANEARQQDARSVYDGKGRCEKMMAISSGGSVGGAISARGWKEKESC
jgi:hypothetical protein